MTLGEPPAGEDQHHHTAKFPDRSSAANAYGQFARAWHHLLPVHRAARGCDRYMQPVCGRGIGKAFGPGRVQKFTVIENRSADEHVSIEGWNEVAQDSSG